MNEAAICKLYMVVKCSDCYNYFAKALVVKHPPYSAIPSVGKLSDDIPLGISTWQTRLPKAALQSAARKILEERRIGQQKVLQLVVEDSHL